MGTLRLMLALAVASEHSPFGPLPGFSFLLAATAVQAFFIISGFFIAMVLCENPAYRSPLTFYASRYSRLYPVYIVCALATLAFAASNPYGFKAYGHSYWEFFGILDLPAKIFVLFSNVAIWFQDWFLFLQVRPEAGHGVLAFAPLFNEGTKPPFYAFLWLAQGWSLGIELLFYLVAPFVVRKPWRLAALVVLGLASRAASYALIGALADPWYYRFAPSEMSLFGLGALSYHAYRRLGWSRRTERRAGFAALAAAIVLVGFRGILGPLNPVLGIAIAPLMLWDPVLLGFMVLAVPVIFAATRAYRLDRFLGDLSYPLYLSQVAVAAALADWGAPSPAMGSLAYVGTTFAASIALLLLIDRPMNRLRARSFGAQSHTRARAPEMVAAVS